MDGVVACRTVARANAALVAFVPDFMKDGNPVSRIFAGPAPLGTPLPFVMLESISKNDLNIPSPAAKRFVMERVQATVVAQNYPQQKQIVRAVRRAIADQLYPAVNGISGVTIHTDSAGPDFYDDSYSGWRGSQDFFVRYNEER